MEAQIIVAANLLTCLAGTLWNFFFQKLIVFIDGRSIQENIVLIENALFGDFVLPEFGQFTKHIEDIYQNCKENTDGKVQRKLHSFWIF